MTRRRAAFVILLAWSAAAGCRAREEPVEAETPTLDVTSWTDKTELFMEHPPLVAGQTARFAVHLTRLADFQALTAGKPRVEFIPERGGPASALPGNEPSRPGVFRAEGTVPAAGQYRWALLYDGPGLSDRHDLGVATVFADADAANADAEQRPPEDAAAFSYLKEQQWTNTFAAEPVRERDASREHPRAGHNRTAHRWRGHHVRAGRGTICCRHAHPRRHRRHCRPGPRPAGTTTE